MANVNGLAVIKPIAHAGVACQSKLYRSSSTNVNSMGAGVIPEGAPVQFDAQTGKIKAIQNVAVLGTAGLIDGVLLGIALNSTTAADQDCMVALALPGARWVCSLGKVSGTDDGTKALALTDVGQGYKLKQDTGTFSTVSGPAQRWAVYSADQVAISSGAVTYNVVVLDLIDKVGSSTGTAVNPPFGGSGGSGNKNFPPPNTTFQGIPSVSDSGLAKVEFTFVQGISIFG